MRNALTVSKRQGIEFGRAWEAAFNGLKGPQLTSDRRDYRTVIAETRWAWERAYMDGEPIPGGAALLSLFEALAPEPEHVPVIRASNPTTARGRVAA